MRLKKIGIIGGTGLSSWFADNAQTERVSTALGEPSAAFELMQWQGKELVFLSRHGNPSAIPPHKINYRANLLALQQQQVDAIIAVNAVGGITASASTGALMLPHQVIDYTSGREHTFFDGIYQPMHFIDFTHPYDEQLKQAILTAAHKLGQPVVANGVYGATQGPRLETIAEIKRMEQDGCDIVGMTGMPEAALARELNIPYVCIALVVNPAAGKSTELITMDDIHRVTAIGMEQVKALISATLNEL